MRVDESRQDSSPFTGQPTRAGPDEWTDFVARSNRQNFSGSDRDAFGLRLPGVKGQHARLVEHEVSVS